MKLFRKPLAALLALALALWPVTATATDDLWDYSATTPGDNVSIGGVSYAENMLPAGVNDGVRALISQLKRALANKGSDISSAATTNICATGTSIYAHVTGTTAITSFGTAAAGCWRLIVFTDALTLTHNATSLVLPGAANITTAANDAALAASDGSGNWRVLVYTTAAGGVVGGFSSLTATSTDAGATAGPDIKALRDSASPADNDLIGRFLFSGRDESANEDIMASIDGQVLDATGGTEDAEVEHKTRIAGTLATRLTVGQGVQIGAPTGGDPGTGELNADTDIQLDGVSIVHGIAQVVRDTEATYTEVTTDLPVDNSIPQITEGAEILSVAITPKASTSTLRITFTAIVGASAAGQVGAGLFVDATAGALNATATRVNSAAGTSTLHLIHTVSAASTSARTYRIRIGPDAGGPASAFLNGDNAGRLMGGVSIAHLEVEEILQQ